MVHLKSSLIGEASSIVSSYPTTSASYTSAWNAVINRYSNEREIAFSHIRKLDDLKPVQETAQGLRKVSDTINECVRSLELLNIQVNQWDVILVYMGLKKLDPTSKKEWLITQSKLLPALDDFIAFVETRATALANSSPAKPRIEEKKKTTYVHHSETSTSSKSCPSCSESHSLGICPTFVQLNIPARHQFVYQRHLCFNCLENGHSVQECKSKFSCKLCHKKHHTRLHRTNGSQPNRKVNSGAPEVGAPQVNETSDPVVSTHCTPQIHSKLVLMGTLLVSAENSTGEKKSCRVFLDPGSECNFVTEKCMRRLNLKKTSASVSITGISGAVAESAAGVVRMKLHSMVSNFSLNIDALVLKKITGDLPRVKCNARWSHIENIELADPSFHIPGVIDILLGAEHSAQILTTGIIRGLHGTPTAQNSQFGWILSGKIIAESQSSNHVQVHHSLTTENSELESSLMKFWESEEPEPQQQNYSKSDEKCEYSFLSNYRRNNDGSYTVQLPFKCAPNLLGHSRDQAVKRFLSIENKLGKNPDVKETYSKTIKDYMESNIVELIPEQELKSSVSYYMPHHFVVKPSSLTTKVRVVFDASAKSSSGFSLNDLLFTGPKLQVDLSQLLIRFRSYLICMSADIEKFYYQYRVDKKHVDFLRFVWRGAPKDPIQDYRFLRVTFGVKPGPYLAIRAFHQLAEDVKEEFPIVCETIKKEFLVGNLLSGAQTVQEALQLQEDLLKVMKRGCLKLRQWVSNCPKVTESIGEDLCQFTSSHPIQEDESVKTIGILWDPTKDSFGISIMCPTFSLSATKRTILSAIAKIFDPLGWLSPVTVKYKILIQSLWKANFDWDQNLPVEFLNTWKSYIEELPLLQQFQLPRCISGNFSTWDPDASTKIEIHGFCDGSNAAFSACVYFKAENEVGGVLVNLVAAKSKVAPVKGDTTPRMELCGALLLVKLIKTILSSVKMEFTSINCWTDSTCVLGWLKSEEKLTVFVLNRIRKIQDILSSATWRHVTGVDNPADSSSRGIPASQLIAHPIWLTGPGWIATTKYPPVTNSNVVTVKTGVIVELINKVSSYSKLIRIIAWILRFRDNLKKLCAPVPQMCPLKSGYQIPLTTNELDEALKAAVRAVQATSFGKEILHLKKQQSPKSSVKFLSPFIDEEGILRVGGRLAHAKLPYSQQHPMLIPSSGTFTSSLIRSFHLVNLHAGPTLLLSIIRQQFWIISGPKVIKRIVRNCVTCFKRKPVSATQLMGEMPSPRVNPSRPFSQVGVDYAGPFTVCIIPGRKPKYQKSYVAVFVCMAIKAVHLELIGDLSTPAFIASLQRFTSRRGLPADIYCDQGRNFIGAAAEFKEFSKVFTSKGHNMKVFDFLADKGVNFHFNPPLSPHHGGLWEAAVKSMKFHLHRVAQDRILSIEEFSTLLCGIEACLNSRPITKLSGDPSDFHPLTPGHFLVGGPLKSIPNHDLIDVKQNKLTRWQLVQQIQQHFWKRWSSEYLQHLNSLNKWNSTTPNIEPGVLVLIHDPDSNLGPTKWRLGRVTKTFPGKNGKTRVCDVITPNGSTYRRPIVKLSILPIYKD